TAVPRAYPVMFWIHGGAFEIGGANDVAFWALIKMGYVSEGRSSFKIGSRASGLVFFPYHSRNGWRKSPAPLVPDRTADGSPTVGRIRILACAGVFCVLESSKLENPSLSERYEPEGPNILGGHTHHTATSPAWMGIPILLSRWLRRGELVETALHQREWRGNRSRRLTDMGIILKANMQKQKHNIAKANIRDQRSTFREPFAISSRTASSLSPCSIDWDPS
ncbi:hypothetical protein PRIPAC_78698, partial [Pristionchus pacificus]|uniref:Uncharacterized protein n=1 Tax=Pristionchus pacificus TaxID=54126 RepID=A0A2A6CQL9_PRIPA